MIRPVKLPFLVTERGRQIVFYGATTVAVGLFAGHYLPHTLCIDKYKEFVQAYRNGQERTHSEKLAQRFQRAIELLNLSSFERKFASSFVVYGFDVFNAGSLKSRFGGLVGLPTNFEYDKAADIDRDDIKIRNQPVKWNTEGGKLLEESLVLTEDEQLFGIARELLTLNTYKTLVQAFLPTSTWVFTYTLASQINQRCNFYTRPRALRMMLYTICGFFGFAVYSFCTDMTEIYYDTEVDRQLVSLGPEMAHAGARFYEKILKKNVAIRQLTGDDYYTAKGNVNYLLRQKAAPLTIRREFFDSGYKEVLSSSAAN